ncbi:nanos homolog 1 [Hemiscyllium ocellatum]|uniref:nanos homolog 1 n=1 Tax=Hemiscyllium ocellatum TaxID=170820 RepID=UPI002965D441|nr:nanos homolog 1 [Hemiscyllium ocellatum]
MDLLNSKYLSPGGTYDYTFNFWTDYLGLSALVMKSRKNVSRSPNSITESLKATLGLNDAACPCLAADGDAPLQCCCCCCSPNASRGWLELEDTFSLFDPVRPFPASPQEPELLLDPFAPLDLLGLERKGFRRGSSGRAKQEPKICVFCRNNGAPEDVYSSHVLKTPDGRVTCPILRAYTCPLCHASGDNAHTIKYCPLSKDQPPQRLLKGGRAVGGGKRLKIF